MNRPHPLPMAVNLFATVLVTDYFRSFYTKVHSAFGSRKLQKILKIQHFTGRAPNLASYLGLASDVVPTGCSFPFPMEKAIDRRFVSAYLVAIFRRQVDRLCEMAFRLIVSADGIQCVAQVSIALGETRIEFDRHR